MTERLLSRLGVKREDRRKLTMLTPIFFLCGIAEMIVFNGYLTLFNDRFGSEYLPYMYAAEAVILPVEAWVLSRLTGRVSKPRLMRIIFLLMGAVVTANAVLLLGFRMTGADYRLYYPILFLTSSFVVRQQTILMWSLAVDLCPTQQAKRLMPFFVSFAALGGIAAGLIGIGVSKRYGADVVYMLGPLLLAAGSIYYFRAIRQYLVPLTLKEQRDEAERKDAAPTGGYYKNVLTRPYLLAVLGILMVMPGLYFLMEYVFLNMARTIYGTESEFSSFFGMITSLLFTLALTLQLVSGRIQAWLGPSNVLTGIAFVFGAGFVVTALTLSSPVMLYAISVSYTFFYLLLYYMAEPANQTFFKILPIDQRDGYRYLVQGLSASAGIGLGALMQWLHIGVNLDWHELAWLGAAVSIGLILLTRYTRSLYLNELVGSVHNMIAVGSVTADSFDEFSRHSQFPSLLAAMLDHPNDYAREVALELIGRYKPAAFLPKLLHLFEAPSARIRMAAVMAADVTESDLATWSRMAALLTDSDFEVRTAVIRQLGQSGRSEPQAAEWVRSMLDDPHPQVVAEAVKALYRLQDERSYGVCAEVVEGQLARGGDPAVSICSVIGDLGLDRYIPEICTLLGDPSSAVREAAIESLGKLRHAPAVPMLLEQLEWAEPTIRDAVQEAFIRMGPLAEAPLLAALEGAPPKVWSSVIRSLAAILTWEHIRERLVPDAVRRLEELWGSRGMPAIMQAESVESLAGLAEARLAELRTIVMDAAWAILERLMDESVVRAVKLATEDEDVEIRDSGIEVLTEGIGDSRLTSALLPYVSEWTEEPLLPDEKAPAMLRSMAEHTDPWLRQLAAEALSKEWKNPMAGSERQLMGLLDKVVFLKQVPFFSELTLDELGRVAGIAEEQFHKEGTVLFKQGTPNHTLGVIVDGRVSISATGSSGSDSVVSELRQNFVYGENSSLYGTLTTASGKAVDGDLHILAIEGEKLSKLVRLYPGIGIGLLRAAFERVRRLEQSIAERSG